MKKKGAARLLDKDHVGYLFILPSCLIIFIFTIIPLLASFVISLTNMDIFLGQPDFLGLENFVRSFGDERVPNAFKNTFVYVLWTVPVQMVLSLILAYWLYRPTRFNKLCRSIYYVPVLCSFTAIGILFNLILNSTVGYIPYIVSLFSGSVTALLSDVR